MTNHFSITDVGDVSLVFEMGVTRDREKRTVTTTQEKYSKSPMERYDMARYNPT